MFNEIKDKLLQIQLFIDNEFLNKYLNLIILNLSTKRELYKTQRHHIIPKKVFKIKGIDVDNSRKNLVNLLYKDHILAHYYLCKCTVGNLYGANVKAVVSMVNKDFRIINEQWILDNLCDFQKLYEENSKNHSKFFRQVKRPIGWHHSDEVKLKMSQSHMGKIVSDTTKQKMKQHHYNCTGENNPAKGRHWYNNGTERLYLKEGDIIPEGFVLGSLPQTDIEKQKRSASLKGKKSKSKGTHWYNNGIVEIMTKHCPQGFTSGRLKK